MILGAIARRNMIRIEGERSSAFDLARGRLVLISAFFVMAYMILAVRAFDLMIIQGELSVHRVEELNEAASAEPAPPLHLRGEIFDRNGEVLATTLETASLFADTALVSDPAKTAQSLVDIFPDLQYGSTLQKLQSGKRFVWLKRSIMPEEQRAVLSIGEPGLEFEYESARVYPQGNLASHILGYTNVDGTGLAAIERNFNTLLGGGKTLSLTVDLRIQHAVRREVARAISEFNAKAGVGLVMDVNTGELIAGVSLPDFDPNNPGSPTDPSLFNRMVLGVYELGSVFKIFSTAALFETKHVPMGTTFDAREPIKRGRFTINDYHSEDRILTVPEVFMYSSNIGSAMMGEAVGTEALQGVYRDLGLLTPLDFEIREVGRPLVPEPWREINTLTASYGHGIATTPLQLITAVSTVVNGGYMVKPTLIKAERSAHEKIRVLSEETSRNMRELLRLTVTDGTGKSADVPGYLVGGKTGTAEKAGIHGYDRKKLISSFVGVFPSNAPRYAIFVAVDEPKGNKASYGYATGGWVGAPTVARIIRSMVSILGIEPVHDGDVVDPAEPLRQYVSKEGKHG